MAINLKAEITGWLARWFPDEGDGESRQIPIAEVTEGLEKLLRRVDSFAGGGRGEAATGNRLIAALRGTALEEKP